MSQPPAPPYVGPAAHTSPGDNMPIHRIVIHATVSPCEKGGARGVAAYFRSPSAGGSAHYVVDPYEEVQVVWDRVIAWHAPPNPNSLGIELTDPQAGPGSRWQDDLHQKMLVRAAVLTAELAAAYNVPLHFIDTPQLLAGNHGITGHVYVSQAWHQSTHTDPGPDFPWTQFMDLVHQAANGNLSSDTPVHSGGNPVPVPSHGGNHRVKKVTPATRNAIHVLRDLLKRHPKWTYLHATIQKLLGR